jgi:hypothetical protein
VTNVIDSILTSTKKSLGMDESYTAFDEDIIMHINSAFTNLNDIGIGPDEGFMIEDKNPTWDQFIGTSLRLNSVKNYVWLYTKLAFDPPDRSFVIEALETQLEEVFGRLSIRREQTDYVDPEIVVEEEDVWL